MQIYIHKMYNIKQPKLGFVQYLIERIKKKRKKQVSLFTTQ